MSLNDYFDRIYCIHITGNAERYENIQKFKKDVNCDVEIFQASTPDTLNIPENSNHKYEYACTHSHLSLWKKIIQDNPNRPLILEDDAKICNQDLFNMLERNCEIVNSKNVDILFLGLNYARAVLTYCNEDMVKVLFAYALHAYSPTVAILQRLVKNKYFDVDKLYENPNPIIDVRTAQILKEVSAVVFKKALVTQMPCYSHIQNEYRNYTGWLQ